ncbi:hypothetical protein PG997_014489 [Apiospora hydei]|uniref:Major facilitator superfamily (MFS) profile domain-containing protein n=1 Tax=Apiospora hydei TaxID=1337664 RepID=A0ABR1UUK4_9PEZI
MASSEPTRQDAIIEGSSPYPSAADEKKEYSDSEVRPMSDLIRDAKLATEKEHSMSLWQGIKLYPKAIAWSVLISTCIVMEGYDVSLVNNFYAFQQFNKKYGEQLPDGTYQRFGYRYTVMGCLCLVIAFTAIFFTAQNVVALQVAEILCGVPWGVFQTITITYASEVCPVALRGYLTTYINICWGIGQEIGIGVIMGNLWRTDEWAYRIPYALQWMWPVPLIIGIYFAPESPWWLVRKGKLEDAKRSLLRLTTKRTDSDFDADETVAMMVHTTALEAKITKGASYLDCFKGTDLRRTEIVCMAWAIQNLSGNSFSNYSTYFLEQAGMSPDKAYSFALGQYAINCVGVFGTWTLITLGIGRRSLYLYGLTFLIMLVWAMGYQLTVGTVCYSLVAEISTRRLQIKTIVLGRILYNVVAIICGILTPYMLNPGAWNWSNFAGFFWAGICFLCLVYSYFRIPEPTGRSFAELDLLFEKGISARKFATTEINVFEEQLDPAVAQKYRDQIAITHMEKQV